MRRNTEVLPCNLNKPCRQKTCRIRTAFTSSTMCTCKLHLTEAEPWLSLHKLFPVLISNFAFKLQSRLFILLLASCKEHSRIFGAFAYFIPLSNFILELLASKQISFLKFLASKQISFQSYWCLGKLNSKVTKWIPNSILKLAPQQISFYRNWCLDI